MELGVSEMNHNNPRVARDPRRPVNLMQVRVFRIAGFWGIVERPA